ncbi:MAG TPA: nucleotidyl transferase AbiEii/AbiGii toxin family protein [Solirubrobacteraceae bacterium]|nr:nucleotidyl transferase AbiEii/AbiGii toxin family protein [Solirubrobacteraceae bacterium]
MASSRSEIGPTALLRVLGEGLVDFVVIGGVAVVVQASPRFTRDLDICHSTTPENLERLAGVLLSLEARLRGVDADLPFKADARTLRRAGTLTLTTNAGDLDLLAEPAGSPGYAALRRRALVIDLDGLAVRVASLEDLIAMKQAASRPQDLIDVESLEAARARLRGRRAR